MLDVYHNSSLDSGLEARSLKRCLVIDGLQDQRFWLGPCSQRPETNVSISVTNTKWYRHSLALNVLTCTTASLFCIFEFATTQAALTFITGSCFSSCSRRFESQKAKILGPVEQWASVSSLTCNWKGYRSSRKSPHPIYGPWWAWCWSELLSGLKILNICLASYCCVANESKCRLWIWGVRYTNRRPLLGVLSSFRKLPVRIPGQVLGHRELSRRITRGKGTWMNQDHMLQRCGSSPGHHLLNYCP